MSSMNCSNFGISLSRSLFHPGRSSAQAVPGLLNVKINDPCCCRCAIAEFFGASVVGRVRRISTSTYIVSEVEEPQEKYRAH